MIQFPRRDACLPEPFLVFGSLTATSDSSLGICCVRSHFLKAILDTKAQVKLSYLSACLKRLSGSKIDSLRQDDEVEGQ